MARPANEVLEETFQQCCDMDASLNERLAHFAEVSRSLNPRYATLVDELVDRLARNGAGEGSPKPGDPMPGVLLSNQAGQLVSLSEVLKNGPVALMFHRGHWCPYCRISIAALAKAQQRIEDLGARMVAIVPERAEFAEELKLDSGVGFPILSDIDNGYAMVLNLAIWVGAEMEDFMRSIGRDLPTYVGNDSWTLPIPATFVVGVDGRVRKVVDIPVPGMVMVHDMSLTERFAVVYDMPVTVDFDLAFAGRFPFRWNPDYGSRLGFLPREGSADDIVWVDVPVSYSFPNLIVNTTSPPKEFTIINSYLVRDLKRLGLWDDVMVMDLKHFDGSLRPIDRVPQDVKALYATAFEVEPQWLVEAASRRQKWIDQAQSLNIYMAGASGKKLDETYKLAWLRGLKTTYYLRTMSATHAEKSTVQAGQLNAVSSGAGNGGMSALEAAAVAARAQTRRPSPAAVDPAYLRICSG